MTRKRRANDLPAVGFCVSASPFPPFRVFRGRICLPYLTRRASSANYLLFSAPVAQLDRASDYGASNSPDTDALQLALLRMFTYGTRMPQICHPLACCGTSM